MEVLGLLGFAGVIFLILGAFRGFSAFRRIEDTQEHLKRLESRIAHLSDRLARAEHGLRSGPGPVEAEAETVTEAPTPGPVRPVAAPKTLKAPPPIPPAPEDEVEVEDFVADAEIPRQRTPIHTAADRPPIVQPERIRAAQPDPLTNYVRSMIKRLGPNDPNMTWEMALGTYWLPRLGAAAISVAVVFLLTLALQRWGPPFRVAIGYAISATLLIGGWRLDKKYPTYARVLFGAGFAILYFVTFATYFVPYVKLFETPVPTLIGLAAIVVAWAALAVRRRSPIIAGVAVLLGNLTIALTTLTLDEPVAYSVLGIVALSAGSAFFLLRMRWYYIAAIGMLASYANHFLVMSQTESTGTVVEFSLGMAVLATYLLIFALAEMFSSEKVRREAIPNWFRNIFVTTNTVCFFVLGTMLMSGYDFAEDYQHLFRYGLALVLLPIGILYLRVRAGDPLYNAYLIKGVTFATFGLATQFSAYSLSTWLAVEILVLLVSSRQSGLAVTRVLAFVVGVIAFGHALYMLTTGDSILYGSEEYLARLFQGCITVLSFFAASRFYQWVDWSTRSPRTLPLDDTNNLLLWKLDIVAERPASHPDESKPLNGLLFPYFYALGGVVLILYGYVPFLTEQGDRGMVIAILALVLAGFAVGLRSAPFGRGVAILAVVALIPWWVHDLLHRGSLAYADSLYPAVATKAAATFLVFLVLSEFVRRMATNQDEVRRGVFPALAWVDPRTFSIRLRTNASQPTETQEQGFPYLLGLGALIVFTGWSLILFEEGHRFLAFGLLALTSAIVATLARALPFGLVSIAAFLLAGTFGTIEILSSLEKTIVIPSLIVAGLTALLSEKRYVGERAGLRFHQHLKAPYPLYALVAWLLGLYLTVKFETTQEVFALLISALAASGLVLILHRRALAMCSLGLLLWAQLMWHLGWTGEADTTFLALAWAIIAAAILSDRYYARLGVSFVLPVHLIAAWVLLFSYIYLEAAREWASMWWAVGSAAFLVYAGVFRVRTAALLALAGTAIASVHQVVYAYEAQMDLTPLLVGFLAPTLLWMALERGSALVRSRVDVKLPFEPAAVLVGAAAVLLVVMFERIPALAEFYLTISWSVLGVALFAFALTFKEKMYRYAGLAVLLLASLRVLIVDTRELEAFPKVGAWGVLGAVLIALGYGYVRAFARTQDRDDPPPSEAKPDTTTTPDD